MKRREAIKGLGMSLGLVVATPTVISILQSCKTDPKIDWAPQFFAEEQGVLLKKLVGYILPATENLPGANDVNVAQFIDKYAAMVASKEDQDNFVGGLTAIATALGKDPGAASDADYDAMLTKFLKATPDQIEAFQQNEGDKNAFEALMGLRGISIWGYKNSQKVGMEVLAYDPIPGEFNGCISLEDATGGRSWSL